MMLGEAGEAFFVRQEQVVDDLDSQFEEDSALYGPNSPKKSGSKSAHESFQIPKLLGVENNKEVSQEKNDAT